MAYTGVQIFADLKRQASQYQSDVIVPTMGNYLLKKALFEEIEDNYKNLAVQKNKDELGSLIKTEKPFTIWDNGVNVGIVPISSVVVASGTTFTITFLWAHHLGTGISITLSEILGTPLANGTYTFTSGTPSAGQYVIVNSNTITLTVASATGTYTANTGIMTNSNIVTDYLHLLTAKVVFEQSTKFTVNDATFASPIKLTINENNNLRSTEKIKVSGVGGNTNANATSFIRKGKLKEMYLYSNEELTTAVAGNANYTSGGTLKRIVENYCKPQESDKKIDWYKATVKNPLIETTQKQLMVYPKDKGAVTMYIDYITTETRELTVTSTIDYELYYNRTFLDKVVNRATQNFANMVEDPTAYQMITAQINQNTNAIS
jgi:hypothetical protein